MTLRRTWALPAGVAVVAALATGLLACAHGPRTAASQPVDVTNRWSLSSPHAQGMDGRHMRLADTYVRERLPDVLSLLVVRHGRIVLERYYGPSRRTAEDVQSVTKSVMSTLVGIALARHELESLDQKLVDLLPASDVSSRADPRAGAITLRHLLTMSAGFAGDLRTGDFGYTARTNWSKALIDRQVVGQPGSKFAYDSGTAHVLSAVLTKATGMPAQRYAARYLFEPLGIDDAVWPQDPTGNSLGGSGLELSTRDLAKLGYLYLHKGRWHGRQIVPASWVEAATTPQIATGRTDSEWGYPPWKRYGYLWWMYPPRRPQGFAAIGRGGQFVIVWPALDLIVVTTAVAQDEEWDLAGLVEKFILPGVLSDR